MKKDSKKTVAAVKKRSGVVEALIQSIIPMLVLICLLLGFWNLVGRDSGIAVQTGYASQIPVMFADIVVKSPVLLLGIPCLLGFNFLAYYVVFRIVRKCVAYPWCCVAVFSQLMVVCFCIIGGAFAGDIIRSAL